MKKLLTIGITVHNDEDYINRCVDGVISCIGNRDDVEIIISNNNSSDSTEDKALQYEKKFSNVKVVSTSKAGPSVARNAVINAMKGEYVTFIDGDDYVTDDLSKLLDVIEKNKDVDMFHLSYKIIKEQKTFIPNCCDSMWCNKKLSRTQFLEVLKLNTAFSSSSCKVIRTSIIKDNNLEYNEDHFQMEDMEFGVKVWGSIKTAMILDFSYYVYEVLHTGSLTHKISIDRMCQAVDASIKSYEWIDKNIANKKESKKLKQFVSLLNFSLIRRYNDLDKNERKVFKELINKNEIILSHPNCLATKLFYIVYRIFGLDFACKFV